MLAHLQLGRLVRIVQNVILSRLIHLPNLPVTLLAAFFSDRYESRGITAALVSMLAVIGFSLYLGKVLYLNEDSFWRSHVD